MTYRKSQSPCRFQADSYSGCQKGPVSSERKKKNYSPLLILLLFASQPSLTNIQVTLRQRNVSLLSVMSVPGLWFTPLPSVCPFHRYVSVHSAIKASRRFLTSGTGSRHCAGDMVWSADLGDVSENLLSHWLEFTLPGWRQPMT